MGERAREGEKRPRSRKRRWCRRPSETRDKKTLSLSLFLYHPLLFRPSHLDRSLLHEMVLEYPLQVGRGQKLRGREVVRGEVRRKRVVGGSEQRGLELRVRELLGQVRGLNGSQQRGQRGSRGGDGGDGRLG